MKRYGELLREEVQKAYGTRYWRTDIRLQERALVRRRWRLLVPRREVFALEDVRTVKPRPGRGRFGVIEVSMAPDVCVLIRVENAQAWCAAVQEQVRTLRAASAGRKAAEVSGRTAVGRVRRGAVPRRAVRAFTTAAAS